MATRNQVLSMFGASPEQIMQQEAMRQAETVQAIRDPYQQVGSAIGVGLGRLFGGESAEVTRQRELFDQLQGVDFQNPEQMREAASQLQGQFPDRALQLLMLADDMETSAQQRATSAAQAEAAGIKSVPKFIGMTYERSGTDVTGEPTYTPRPLYENVPIPAKDLEDYYAGTGKYKGWLAPTADKAPNDSTDEGIKRDPNAVTIEGSAGANVVIQNDEYYFENDEGDPVGKPLTKEQLGQLGVKIPEAVVPDTPEQAAKRARIEPQIKQNRLQQSLTNPTGTVFDPNNPFAGGM